MAYAKKKKSVKNVRCLWKPLTTKKKSTVVKTLTSKTNFQNCGRGAKVCKREMGGWRDGESNN